MGVDVYVLDFLLGVPRKTYARTLWLGRQHFSVNFADARVKRVLDKYGVEPAAIQSRTGYAEQLFRFLGSDRIESLDMSSFEGAEIICDLSKPLPPELEGQFDLVFDGGTVEHVYEITTAFDNVRRLVKVGGALVSVNGANNQLGHGFYQFSPELLWRTFSKDAGFQVERMHLVDVGAGVTDARDPAAVGRRLETGTTVGSTYIMVHAVKVENKPRMIMYQSDYASAWARSEAAQAGA